MKTISVSTEFSKMPCVRSRNDGRKSGQEFREDFLVPALRENSKVVIDLNGVLTLGSSFLDEAFGGLVRVEGFSARELKNKLEIKFALKSYVDETWKYIEGKS